MRRWKRFFFEFWNLVLEVAGRVTRSDVVRSEFDAAQSFNEFCLSSLMSNSPIDVDKLGTDQLALSMVSSTTKVGVKVW